MNHNFERRNEAVEKALKELGESIKGKMPPGWGFTLLMYDYNTNSGSLFYISSAERGDMIKAMQEFIRKNGITGNVN